MRRCEGDVNVVIALFALITASIAAWRITRFFTVHPGQARGCADAGTGPSCIKALNRVSDLNDVFGWTAQTEYVCIVRASAPPLTAGQEVAAREFSLPRLLEREAKRKKPRGRGALA